MSRYLFLLIPKEPGLTRSQIKTLVDICIAVGEIGLGTVAIPVILEKGSSLGLAAGLALCLGFWYIAIRVSRGLENE